MSYEVRGVVIIFSGSLGCYINDKINCFPANHSSSQNGILQDIWNCMIDLAGRRQIFYNQV